MTYFFDTSALVKRYHPEVGSSKVEAIFREHNRRIIISRLTVVELQSAFAAKVRTGQLAERSAASLRFRALDDVGTGTVTVVSVKDIHYAVAARYRRQWQSHFGPSVPQPLRHLLSYTQFLPAGFATYRTLRCDPPSRRCAPYDSS